MSDHTHFVSLSICLSIDLAFSHRIFHALSYYLSIPRKAGAIYIARGTPTLD